MVNSFQVQNSVLLQELLYKVAQTQVRLDGEHPRTAMFKSCGRLLDSMKVQTLTEPFLLVKKL